MASLATNALIERRGAKVAAITTAGFRDILEIGYERRYDQYDIMLEKPDLLVTRERCWTVPERVTANGDVLEPLIEQTFERACFTVPEAANAPDRSAPLDHRAPRLARARTLREQDITRRVGSDAVTRSTGAGPTSCTPTGSVEPSTSPVSTGTVTAGKPERLTPAV